MTIVVYMIVECLLLARRNVYLRNIKNLNWAKVKQCVWTDVLQSTLRYMTVLARNWHQLRWPIRKLHKNSRLHRWQHQNPNSAIDRLIELYWFLTEVLREIHKAADIHVDSRWWCWCCWLYGEKYWISGCWMHLIASRRMHAILCCLMCCWIWYVLYE